MNERGKYTPLLVKNHKFYIVLCRSFSHPLLFTKLIYFVLCLETTKYSNIVTLNNLHKFWRKCWLKFVKIIGQLKSGANQNVVMCENWSKHTWLVVNWDDSREWAFCLYFDSYRSQLLLKLTSPPISVLFVFKWRISGVAIFYTNAKLLQRFSLFSTQIKYVLFIAAIKITFMTKFRRENSYKIGLFKFVRIFTPKFGHECYFLLLQWKEHILFYMCKKN